MKKLFLFLVAAACSLGAYADEHCAGKSCCAAQSACCKQGTLNLTPTPTKVVAKKGECTLPEALVVSVDKKFGEPALTDAQSRFTAALLTAGVVKDAKVGYAGEVKNAFVKFQQCPAKAKLGAEGYQLDITAKGITVKAQTATGCYYAMQSIKKMLCPAAALGKPCPKKAGKCAQTDNCEKAGHCEKMQGCQQKCEKMQGCQNACKPTLPCVSITDSPRFGYRGFMLDCSRHFWPMDELKKVIDIMAIYKMNTFHWHLTDDQGWRAEIKKYPKLTTIGATSHNVRITDFENGTYWTNEPYGPYFYSQDDMRELVHYAAERHINVLPEVDMPGHFCAAMAAYPEFSCTPKGEHTMPTHQGGVWNDVMNVANPRAVQFVKDIIDELCEIFPYPYFHIGGDECPTAAWEKNADCQKRYEELGLTNYRQLQSKFINEISGYLRTKGRTCVVWNESVTAPNANLDWVKEHQPLVMSWHPCQQGVDTATKLGLQAIVTEYHAKAPGESGWGGYYINRRPSKAADVPDGAGYGDDTVEGCYKYVPVPTELPAEQANLIQGVQATFWCEWVGVPEYLEYLMLPRLVAVAEAGWTPEANKNYDDFIRRMTLDTKLFHLGGYNYHKHWMKK